ncbi:hypothetical protein FACS1894195_2810 [Bacteroidia bacterium]|nr:hypothetical protein FACS1894195_2810 [Bacteroidia bacterium]
MAPTITVCLLLCGGIAAAQTPTHEFSAYALGGLSSVQYSAPSSMKVAGGFGGGAGFGYTYFMTPQWGISTGLEFSLSSATLTADNYQEKYELLSFHNMTFISDFVGYEEKQSATYLHIPLMLRFQTTGTHRFQAGAGLKLGFALSGSYAGTIKSLTTSGAFPKTEIIVGGEPQHALTEYPNESYSGDLSLGLNVAIAVDAGMRWGLSEKLGLYTGVYLDYGVVNVLPSPTAHLVEYDPNSGKLTYNSAFTTQLLDKANLFSVGVKVGLAFGL